MSHELKKFFKVVKSDTDLQSRLFNTDKISEVASIATEYGYQISAIEVLRTQAGRVILLPLEEQEILAAGEKPKTGAQWGRNGKGYLDCTGHWLNQFISWGSIPPANEPSMEEFIELAMEDKSVSKQLEQAKNCNEVANLASKLGFKFDGVLLLKYMASQVLTFNEEKLNALVNGADRR